MRGRVVAAGTGSPIRRAVVNLSPAPPPIQSGAAGQPSVSVQPLPPATPFGPQRRTVTDAEGRFAFTDVASGSYRIFVSPGQHSGQHVAIAYGAKPSEGPLGTDPGLTIQLSDGQTIDKVVIALPRGAVISGRIMDEAGEPLARVQVYALAFPAGSPRGIRVGSGVQTDDLGQFRLFGLQSGEFVVAADARNNTFVAPNSPQTDADQVGFMTTYYPGVTDESAAQRVRARAGTETSGVEIRVGSGRLFRVSGTILDAEGRAVSRSNGELIRRGTAFGNTQNFFFQTDGQGAFQMQNIPPGDYRLVMRYPNSTPAQAAAPTDPQLAYQPVTVAGDVENLSVILRPGTTISPGGGTSSRSRRPRRSRSCGRDVPLNQRQRLVINRLLEGFEGKLTTSKWATLTKSSTDTALRDIQQLVERGVLVRNQAGGRSTSYSLAGHGNGQRPAISRPRVADRWVASIPSSELQLQPDLHLPGRAGAADRSERSGVDSACWVR